MPEESTQWVIVLHGYPPCPPGTSVSSESVTPEEENAFHPEWRARADEVIEQYRKGDIIIVTGGRYYENGKEMYNNPLLMRNYLVHRGVPNESILCRYVGDDKVGTSANPTDTRDEILHVLKRIQEEGWDDVAVCPVSNKVHLKRIEAMIKWYARKMGMTLVIRPLPTVSQLGPIWAFTEIFLRLYTRFDPGWNGPLPEMMRARRRRGCKKRG